MSIYKTLKSGNIKFPMSGKMFEYYEALGFKCFVIKYFQRMDGSVYVSPEIFYTKDHLIDCLRFSFFDREDIRAFLNGNYTNHFKLKYKQKSKEIFERK